MFMESFRNYGKRVLFSLFEEFGEVHAVGGLGFAFDDDGIFFDLQLTSWFGSDDDHAGWLLFQVV